MASTIQLKRRIRTAQNISKTTRAMNMIATSKLKRAQESAVSSRPYSEKLGEVAMAIAENVEPGEKSSYLKASKSEKEMYIVISPDKGLCGGMIANLARTFTLETKNKDVLVMTIGKKMEPYILRAKKEIVASFPFGNTVPAYSAVLAITKVVDDFFLTAKAGKIYLLTTQFVNVFTQSTKIIQLLPLQLNSDYQKKILKPVSLFEPSSEEILPAILRRYIEMTIYHAMTESYAAEQAARMTAMKNATDNANDIIEELKLVYNKTRQEKITGELLDISGSAFAAA